MGNSTKKCANCGMRGLAKDGYQRGLQWFHSQDAWREYALKQTKKLASTSNNKSILYATKKTKAKKEAGLTRAQLYDKLQALCNQWVLRVRDAGKPCRTCGDTRTDTHHAGHYRSRGACKELRFTPSNISRQCNECNGLKSGNRRAYRNFIIKNYGKKHLDWLDGPHPALKDIYPDKDDINEEIKSYRVLIREAGLIPCR